MPKICGLEREGRIRELRFEAPFWVHQDDGTVCRAPLERPERKEMAVKEIKKRIAVCDRCQSEQEQPIEETTLPTTWGHVRLECPCPEDPAKPVVMESDLCPKCGAIIREAMRPLQRPGRRSSTAEQQPALVTA